MQPGDDPRRVSLYRARPITSLQNRLKRNFRIAMAISRTRIWCKYGRNGHHHEDHSYGGWTVDRDQHHHGRSRTTHSGGPRSRRRAGEGPSGDPSQPFVSARILPCDEFSFRRALPNWPPHLTFDHLPSVVLSGVLAGQYR